VAYERLVRVPEVRTAASSVLGRTFAAHSAPDVIAGRNADPKRFGSSNGIENPMFITTALAALVLLSLVLSMLPCPGIAGVRS